MSGAFKLTLSALLLVAFVTNFSVTSIAPTEDSLFEVVMGVSSPVTEIQFQERVLKDITWGVTLDQTTSSGAIIYEDERVQIQVSLTQYLTYSRLVMDNSPKRLELTLPTLEELIYAAETNPPASKYSPKYVFAEYRYTIGGILKSGQVAIYDKRTRSRVTAITIQDRLVICGPLCGSGSWLFYLPDGTLFFEVTYIYF